MIDRLGERVDQGVGQVQAESLSNDHPEHRDVGRIVGHRVRGHLPPVDPQPFRHVEDRERHVGFHREREDGDRGPVAHELERSELGDLLRGVHREVAERLHHAAVPVATQPEEVVVLAHDLVPGTGEVQREGRHVAAQVVHVEDQVLGEILAIAPDHEADARVDEPVLVAGHVDRLHHRQPEVPRQVGVQERRDEAPARGVDVHRHVEPGLGVARYHRVVDRLDRLELTGVGGAQDRDHADRALVDPLDGLFGRDHVAAFLHRHVPRLDVPVPAELLPDHLDVRSEDQVGAIGRQARRLAALPPAPLHREAREHHGLARADRRGADRVARLGSVEQVRHHVHAAPLDLGGLRVLVLVDHVLVEGLGHQAVGLGLHPRRDERREVQAGAAVEQQLVVDQAVRGLGPCAVFGHLELRDRLEVEALGVRRRDSRARLRVFTLHTSMHHDVVSFHRRTYRIGPDRRAFPQAP